MGSFLLDHIAGGQVDAAEVLRSCIQCGTCSAVCPMSEYMDHSPRVLNEMLLSGREDEVLRSSSIWACTSCYACTVECPEQIPVTDMIYALKRESMRTGVQPDTFPSVIMARQFIDLVNRRGRSSEFWISLWLSLRTQPSQLLRNAPLALRLLRRGRMTLRHDDLRRPGQVRQIFDALDATDGERA